MSTAATLPPPIEGPPLHACAERSAPIVTLPPISSLIESLQQDQPPTSSLPPAREVFARTKLDETDAPYPIRERSSPTLHSTALGSSSFPSSDLRRFHSPSKSLSQSPFRPDSDFTDRQNAPDEPRRRPLTAGSLPSTSSPKRFSIVSLKDEGDLSCPPPPLNSASRSSVRSPQPPSLFRRRSNSLSLPPNAGGFYQPLPQNHHLMDDDRTPTVEHPNFPLHHMPPGATVGEAVASTEQRFHPHPHQPYYSSMPQQSGWFDPYRQRQAVQGYYHPAPLSVSPRKRSEPLCFVESSSPRGAKSQYGRPRAASFSSADEYRSIPAWAGEGDTSSIGGYLSSAGSSPRPIGSPVDTNTSESSAGSVRSSFSVESSASTSPPTRDGGMPPPPPVGFATHQGPWVVSPRAVPMATPGSNGSVPYVGRHGSIGGPPDLSGLDIGSGPSNTGWSHVPHYASSYYQAHQPPRVLVHPGAHAASSAWGPRGVMEPVLRPPGGMGMPVDEDPNADAGRYACPHCSKRFARPSSLRIHIHSHTGEKPFDCHMCGRGFSVQSNLRRHLKIHANAGKKGRAGARKDSISASSESGKSRSSADEDEEREDSTTSASESDAEHAMDEDEKEEIDELEDTK